MVSTMFENCEPGQLYDILKMHKTIPSWFQKCISSDEVHLPLLDSETHIAQVYKHNLLKFPLNEKELIFEPIKHIDGSTFYIALHSDY